MSLEDKVTLPGLRRHVQAGGRFACLTAYDASFGRLLDAAGVDVVLVGDSLGMVVQGHGSTLPVTLDEMVYHTACVGRGCRRALLMADMPFLSDATPDQAVAGAGRLLKEGGAEIVKLEGGRAICGTVERLASRGIPVCGHLGLRPQSVHKTGGYRVQGRDEAAAAEILADAEALEAAGIDLLVLECVPAALAERVCAAVSVPVIGIGAGPACPGQVLVLYDMLGLSEGPRPRFVEDFLAGKGSLREAVEAYCAAVREGRFPGERQTYR